MANLLEVQERLRLMPQHVVNAYAEGANLKEVPPFMALAENLRRKQMREAEAAEEAKEMAGAPSIKDQLSQAVNTMSGIAALKEPQMPQKAAPQQLATAQAMPVQAMAGGGIAGGMNPDMIKKLMVMAALKQRGGIDRLPLPKDMFKREDYAGGGIVAFQKGGSAADVINAAIEDSEDASQDVEAAEAGVSREERDMRDLLRRIRQMKTLEQMKQEAGIGERPDERAERLKALEAERQRFGEADTITRRVLALDPKRLGPSMAAYLDKREAGQTSIEARIAEVQDLKAKAAYDAKVGDLAKARAEQMEAIDKERGILKDIGESGYKAALKAQALAGRNAEGDRAAQAYLAAKKAQGDERPDAVILNEGYINYVREKGAAFRRAEIAGGAAEVNMIDKARTNVDARLKDVKSKEFRELNAKMAQDRRNKQAGNPTDLAGEYKNSLYTQELNALQGRGSAPASTPAGSASDPLGIRR